mmetsp:Transcript_24816/g.62406  ORF Transcript_24816/g.62406 Transcript_24816/m.62406 type:complete len:285 (-) Transcript_24816:1769-2623(-)
MVLAALAHLPLHAPSTFASAAVVLVGRLVPKRPIAPALVRLSTGAVSAATLVRPWTRAFAVPVAAVIALPLTPLTTFWPRTGPTLVAAAPGVFSAFAHRVVFFPTSVVVTATVHRALIPVLSALVPAVLRAPIRPLRPPLAMIALSIHTRAAGAFHTVVLVPLHPAVAAIVAMIRFAFVVATLAFHVRMVWRGSALVEAAFRAFYHTAAGGALIAVVETTPRTHLARKVTLAELLAKLALAVETLGEAFSPPVLAFAVRLGFVARLVLSDGEDTGKQLVLKLVV